MGLSLGGSLRLSTDGQPELTRGKETTMKRVQSLSRGSRLLLVLVLGAAVFGVVSGAQAAIPDSSGVINGCYQKNVGNLRVIDPSAGDSCRPSEIAISWSQTGPQGTQGRARGRRATPARPAPPGRRASPGRRGRRATPARRARPGRRGRRVTPAPPGRRDPKVTRERRVPRAALNAVATRDALGTANESKIYVFRIPARPPSAGSVNIIPDGTGTVITSRPVGDTFGDSPDNGTPFIGWRGVGSGGGLLVVHVFCAS